ncbi:lysoplasmalogenase family protein [Corynebacterium sp. S7]
MPQELGYGDFAQRTNQGIEAFVSSVKKVNDRPERIAFLGATELTCWARTFGWEKLSRIVEPLILPLLAGEAVRSPERTNQKVALGAGLASGAVASIEQSRVPENPSGLGVAAVVGNQAGFITRLVDKRAAISTPSAIAAAGVLAAGVGLAAWKNPKLVPATAIGGAATVVTAALANDERFRSTTTEEAGISHGANLVVIAEGARVVRNTVLKGKKGLGARLLDAFTVGAQSVGQMLLTDGVAK